MPISILYILTILCGAALAFQVGMNSKLSQTVESTSWGVFISFLIGTAAILLFQLIIMAPLPNFFGLKAMPIYGWLGGFLGALYVISITFIAPKIGFTTTFTLVVAGQLLASLMLEHFSLLGAPENHITIKKIFACFLVLAGVILSR
jgi:bacterial/archaeal transporter family-2 protein